MPPITVTTPAVGTPTRQDAFAVPVIEAVDYLNSQAALGSNTPDIPNGSFEIGTAANTAPAGWTLETLAAGNSTAFETNQAYTRHGRQSFKMTTPGAITGGVVLVSEDFQRCSEGIAFTLIWQILASVAGTANAVKVRWYDGTESLLGTSTLWSDTATNPTAWTQKDAVATPPASAKLFKIALEGVNNSIAASVYWDGLSIIHGSARSITAFGASGTYTPKTSKLKVRLWGGGGGGGGGANYSNDGSEGSDGGATQIVGTIAYVNGGAKGGHGNVNGSPASNGGGENASFSTDSAKFGASGTTPHGGILGTYAQAGNGGGGLDGGSAGGYGSAGRYGEFVLSVVPGVSLTVTIGSGGAGGSGAADAGAGVSAGGGLVIIEEIG